MTSQKGVKKYNISNQYIRLVNFYVQYTIKEKLINEIFVQKKKVTENINSNINMLFKTKHFVFKVIKNIYGNMNQICIKRKSYINEYAFESKFEKMS